MATSAERVSSRAEIAQMAAGLAAQASMEIGSLDAARFDEARAHLTGGQKIFVSHLPGQTWNRTFEVCRQLAASGFQPVPHIPVRLLEDAQEMDLVLNTAREAGVIEPLLISGDYPKARGPFSCVLDVLRAAALRCRGFDRVSLAGHPEGHPRVSWAEICQAQVDKWRVANTEGLQVTFVTQFCFSAEPVLHWARLLRAAGVDGQLSVGIAGPTSLGRLIKLAAHCGVGASLRQLTARPASMLRLLAEHRPDALMMELAAEKLRQPDLFDSFHLFSLGGFLRTASWLRQFTVQRSF